MNPFEANVVRVSDPLSEHTRSTRKSLLVACVVAIAISTTGLIPEKISALGIEFSKADHASMLWLLGIVVGFLMFSFIVVAAADFIAWRISFAAKAWEEESQTYENARKSMLENNALTPKIREELSEMDRRLGSMWRSAGHVDRYQFIEKLVNPISWMRAVVEFVTPILAGVAALVLLWRASP